MVMGASDLSASISNDHDRHLVSPVSQIPEPIFQGITSSPDGGICYRQPGTVGMSLGDELSLTVIVCTYNRAPQLSRCLHGFSQILARPETWELIIVDNNSSDRTRQLVLRFASTVPRILYAPEITVRHAHDRATPDSIQRVNDGYAKGRGGFYLKHILRGDLELARRAGREILDLGWPHWDGHLL
jgi:hypothetical protein